MPKYSVEILPLNQASSLFREDVERNHGRVLGVMHPYYDAPDLTPIVTYQDRLRDILTSWINSDKPVVIFDQKSMLEEIGDYLPRLAGRVYTVQTENDSPNLIDHSNSWKDFLQHIDNAYHFTLAGQILAFNKLETVLKSKLDPEMQYFISRMFKIIAAGELDAAEWLKMQIVPRYCVGVLARRLLIAGHDVVFSDAVSPNTLVKETKKGRRII